MTKSREEYLHKKSLILARMFRTAYESLGKDNTLTQELLDRYRETRRELPGTGNDGVNSSTRLGASEAYLETQED